MNSTHTSTDAYRRLSRRHFTKDFKRSVVEHLLSNELTVAEVAREHDLHPNQLCRWRNECKRSAISS
ncbi:transposase [Advenella sp. WQ 585]|uniref:Transposase n=1 Tax=Advenella mandrilli TaxID=2800330 RepID=A0ABS1EHP5_9BURK|nr:transposase [Advenella mandrilli]MBK1782536.1 transposase [Advenella mandrilli]